MNHTLIPLMYLSCDWKEHLNWTKLSKHATEIGGQVGEVNVWTGDERIGLAAPAETFSYLKKLNQCGMELFMDSEQIGDDAWVTKWYWDPIEKRIWVRIKWLYPDNTPRFDTMPLDEWSLLIQNYPWD